MIRTMAAVRLMGKTQCRSRTVAKRCKLKGLGALGHISIGGMVLGVTHLRMSSGESFWFRPGRPLTVRSKSENGQFASSVAVIRV